MKTNKMKYLIISTFLLLSPVCFAQLVEMATELSPRDLGAYKFLFSGTADENSVVVFRVTTVLQYPGGKPITKICDDVSYSPWGGKQTASLFFIDPHHFENKKEEPTWHYRGLGGIGSITGEYAGHRSGEKAEIEFESERWGKTKLVFETLIMSYDDAVLLYDWLPRIAPDRGWMGSGAPKIQSEQGDGGPTVVVDPKSDGVTIRDSKFDVVQVLKDPKKIKFVQDAFLRAKRVGDTATKLKGATHKIDFFDRWLLDIKSGEIAVLTKVVTDVYQLEAEDLATLKNLLEPKAEPVGAGQPATRPESKSESGDKPQPESKGRSR